ncbi:MAG: peptidase M23 [Methylococcaceae bacterium]|nr:MAG: peptidase M23 [Methylococcaceae bacterium]
MKNPKHIGHLRSALVTGLLATLAAGASYALIGSDNNLAPPDVSQATYPLLLPKHSSASLPKPDTEQTEAPHRTTHWVKPGETLQQIFAHLTLSPDDLRDVLNSGAAAHALKMLTPGRILMLQTQADDRLEKLVYQQTPVQSIIVQRGHKGFTVELSEHNVDRELTRVSSTIHNSLLHDGRRAGLSNKLIMQLADIFGWDVDFAQDLREGDRFTVIYELLYVNGEATGTGDILAAEFINQGKTYQALRYTNEQGHTDYYTAAGQGLQKAFLRTPVEYAHISSYFSLARKHPILNTIRAHKGVDYAAAVGTPVRSTGSGRIAFMGQQSGYGNVVVVEHNTKYSTLYGHLSRFGSLKKGSPVRQGEIIGYVGQTGLATGPHLHYEFHVDGEHKDPLTVALPQTEPLKSRQMAAFRQHTLSYITELARFRRVSVAQND